MALTRSRDPLVWIDCEMTGLDPSKDTILSIACFCTDANLNMRDSTGFETVIHHSESLLSRMDDWCTRTHDGSGLTRAAIESNITPEQAADALLAYIQRHIPRPGVALLAGNSVHADKGFLVKEPYGRVIRHLHYRILDVSAIKEGLRRWASDEVLEQAPLKQNKHTAREDVLESIEEARFYMRLIEKMA